MTHRSGTTTHYMDIYDAQTGQKTTAEPIKLEDGSDLYAVTDTRILLETWDSDKKRNTFKIMDMTGKEMLDEVQIAKLNNGLVFEAYRLYYNLSQQKGVPMLANDARMYLLDDQTGKATILPDSLVPSKDIDENFESINYLYSDSLTYSFEGTNRQKITLKTRKYKDTVITYGGSFGNRTISQRMRRENQISSKTDYIRPCLIGETLYHPRGVSPSPKAEPICIDNGYLMLSKTKSSPDGEWQFCLIDKNTLAEKWVTVLKKPEGFAKSNEIKFIKLIGTDLLVFTEKSFSRLNLKTGKWAWNQWFWSKEED